MRWIQPVELVGQVSIGVSPGKPSNRTWTPRSARAEVSGPVTFGVVPNSPCTSESPITSTRFTGVPRPPEGCAGRQAPATRTVAATSASTAVVCLLIRTTRFSAVIAPAMRRR